MNIVDVRKSMLENDTPVILEFGYLKDAPNYYRVHSGIFSEALHPINKSGDYMAAPGWSGVLPAKPIRDWLKVTPDCIMDVAIYADKIAVLADNTLATFKIIKRMCDYIPADNFNPGKNILAFIPLELEATQ